MGNVVQGSAFVHRRFVHSVPVFGGDLTTAPVLETSRHSALKVRRKNSQSHLKIIF